MAFRPVADLGRLGPDEGAVVALGGLGLGDVEGGVVTCPLHGWQFDVRTGACRTVPGEGVSCYVVRVEGTTVYVDPEAAP